MDFLLTVAIIVLLGLPLCSAVITLFSSGRLPFRVSGSISFILLFLAAILSWALYFGMDASWSLTLYRWLNTASYTVAIGFNLDILTRVFLVIITSVSAIFYLYALEFINLNEKSELFFCCFNLIVFILILIVLGDNLLFFLLGVQLLAPLTYFLICLEAGGKAKSVFLFQWIGGLCLFLLSLILIIMAGTVDFTSMAEIDSFSTPLGDTFSGLLLLAFVACYCFLVPLNHRYAQTHNSFVTFTLVHLLIVPLPAVYLLSRLCFLFEGIWFVGPTLIFMGLLLAFLSGLIAAVCRRLDKILVYSAASQVGIVLVALGFNLREGAILLVVSNIILLGLFFLSAGAVKLAMKEENNIFKMGRLARSLPMAALMTCMAGMGLAGFPFLVGYWPRQYLLSEIQNSFEIWGTAINSLLIIIFWLAGFTVFRFLFVVFWSKHQPGGGVHESGPGIRTARLVFLLATVAGGAVAYSEFFQLINISEYINPLPLLLWGIMVLTSFGASVFLYSGRFHSPSVPEGNAGFIYRLLCSEFYRDRISASWFPPGVMRLPVFLAGSVEKNISVLLGRIIFSFLEFCSIFLKKICGSSDSYLKRVVFIFILLLTLFLLYLLVGA